MKTERRHDLGTNELARWTAGWVEKIKPYSTLLVGGLVVLMGVAVVGSMMSAASETRQKAAWDAYAMAVNTSDMEMTNLLKVATEDAYGGTVMQEWASATWADRQLFLATQTCLIDRESSKERLRRILDVYEQLAESAESGQLRNRARYGLAQVYELLNRLEDARREYDLVQGDLEVFARDRADHLLSPGVKESYDWLSAAELPRRTLPNAPGTPGSRPAFEADLPNASGIPLNIGGKSLEEIFGGLNEGESEDRYGTDSPSEEKENLDDLFDETPSDDGASSGETDTPAEPATSDETTVPVETVESTETTESTETDTEDTNEL